MNRGDLRKSATGTRPARGEVLELSVESLAFGGAGVARLNGYVVFVQDAVPGDRVRAEVPVSSRRGSRQLAEHIQQREIQPCPDRRSVDRAS